MTSFRPGQIFKGKIIKLFPNGFASLQIGSQKIVAQLEAPMEVSKSYWFQVLPNEGKVRLKVLHQTNGQIDTDKDSMVGLLKSLSFPVNEENKKMLHFYLQERLPINKNSFQETARWLKEFGFNPETFQAIKRIEEKQLPISKMVFQAILEVVKNDPLAEQITKLNDLLSKQNVSNKGMELTQFIQTIMNVEIDSDSVKKYMEQIQKDSSLYEKLKTLLIELLKDGPSNNVKETAEKLLNKITGLQLLSQETGPIHQQIIQIPICVWKKPVDLTIQWNGKKKENGQIDPDFCRVLFYLELENFKETIVDMQIQKRIITIKITNENDQFKQIASPFIEKLKENLYSLQYLLSSVQFIQPPANQECIKDSQYLSANYSSEYGPGVDLRV